MIRPHHDSAPAHATRRRNRRGGRGPGHRQHLVPLTAEGVPAATPDAPPPSPVVFVDAGSRARWPWLPARVIAGSVWRGPGFERVKVDERGVAAPWRTGAR